MKSKKRQMWFVLTTGAISLLLPTICAAQAALPLLPAAVKPCSDDIHSKKGVGFRLPPNALQAARIIGVDSDLARLSELTNARVACHTARSLKELWLRQEITDAVLTASLDADSVLEEIDYEQKQLDELIRIARARRDRAMGATNLAVLTAGTGLGIVAGALSFSDATSDIGNALGFASGGMSTLLSLRSFRLVKGKGRPQWVLPNMLAAFFAQPEEAQHEYSEVTWAYLNSIPSGEGNQASRKEQLLAQWVSEGRLPLSGSPQAQQRIALLTTTRAGERKLDIALLTGRAAMLGDVQHEVSHLKHDLADLLRSLR